MTEDEMRKEIFRGKIFNYFALGILFIIIFLIGVGIIIYKANHTFSIDKWNNDPSQRTKIVNDFIQSNEIIGLTKSEITLLLGEDDSNLGYFNAEDTLIYYLGDEGGLFSVDSEWLIIEFKDDQAFNYYITTD